jgi:hypothetical protein
MAYNFVRDEVNPANSQYLGIDDAISINMPLTIAARFKLNVANVNHNFVSVQTSNGSSAYAVGVNSSAFPIGPSASGGTTSFITNTGTTATIGVWQHVAIVFASTTSRTIYLDNIAFFSSATFTSPGTVAGVRIGTRTNPAGGFNGPCVADIAEVGIWGASLNVNEIRSLVAGVTPDQIRPQSLAFYAPLIREPVDFRGGFTLTNTNGATVSEHPRVYT